MPKDTFLNLSADKRRKIFDAAVQEFSTRRFSEASVNQIVKAAGIPRGSFYQYFNGKEDLFLYMFEQILQEKREVIRRSASVDPDADVFTFCIQATRAVFAWGRLNPQYNRIGMLMEIDNSEFITGLRAASLGGLRKLVERDKERGLIKPDIDADLVAEMIFDLIWKQYSQVGFDEDTFFQKISAGFGILRDGIAGGNQI